MSVELLLWVLRKTHLRLWIVMVDLRVHFWCLCLKMHRVRFFFIFFKCHLIGYIFLLLIAASSFRNRFFQATSDYGRFLLEKRFETFMVPQVVQRQLLTGSLIKYDQGSVTQISAFSEPSYHALARQVYIIILFSAVF
jgi:hypothetical protein